MQLGACCEENLLLMADRGVSASFITMIAPIQGLLEKAKASVDALSLNFAQNRESSLISI